MRKTFWMSLLAAMTMFPSCQDEEIVNEQMEIKGVIADTVNSRTSIDETNDYGSSVGVLWLPNEEIGVYSNYSKNVKFTSTNKSSTGEVTFRGFMFGTPKYAYYPYSTENNGVSYSSVKGNVPQSQSYSHVYKELAADYKVGVLENSQLFGATFEFTRLVCLWKFQVDATGSALEGQTLRSIAVKVNNQRQITGKFTMDLAAQTLTLGNYESGNDSLYMAWSSGPVMSSGSTHIGYVTCLPVIQKNDEYQITITTDTHIATFTHVSKAAHKSNGLYKFTLTLSERDMDIKEISNVVEPEVTPGVTPVLNSMKFTVADNPGKILSRSFSVSTSAKVTTSTVTEATCTIDEENKKISLYLPYLNNRKLVPTFEIPEGTQLVYEGGEIISGQTEVDFATYKKVAVVNTAGEAAIYDVELTNTGLPVVVINQETGTTSSETNSKYTKASNTWYDATGTKWQAKDSDWKMEEGVDHFMIYNADGTSALTDKNGAIVNEPVLASTRVRGNVSQQMPKKPFAVKLDKKHGVLDMPAHKRWVLLANWKDRTLMRNAVAFGIADVFKNTLSGGMAWNPSGQFVELVYNGVHVGNYYLCEQIKIDGNRLDIKDPYDKDDAFTAVEDYGYLLECDDAYDEDWNFTTANYIPFLFKDDGTDEMLTYAQNFVRGIEDNLYAGNYDAAYEKMDLTSLVDYWLIQELMMNSEMQHPKSVYMYINDGKFYAGPIWDFDWNTLPTSTSYAEEGYSYTASMIAKAECYHKSSGYPTEPKDEGDKNYFWYPMLVKDATFKALAAERWNAVKGAIQSYVSSKIPAMKTKIATSEAVNNNMWPVDAKSSSWFNIGPRYSNYGIGGGYCGDEGKTFEDAVNTMISTLGTRISGMNYVSNQSWPSISYTKQ